MAKAYCMEHDKNVPDQEWFRAVSTRIPYGLQENIAIGLRDGTIRELKEHQFIPEGAHEPKHYSWFLGFGSNGPYVWWEAFIHAAEFCRVRALASKHTNLKVGFEDHWMDVTLYRDSGLLACYEVKEKVRDANRLIKMIKHYGDRGIVLDEPDRRNDPLRKAKYLVRHRPKYLSVVAVGRRWEFSVSYKEEATSLVKFKLADDMIPIG